MIANCGTMGLDWRTLDLAEYLEAVEARASDGVTEPAEASEGLKKFMSAHGAKD